MNKVIRIVSGFIAKIQSFFAPGGGAEEALDTVARHLPEAYAIVKVIDSLAPSRTTEEIVRIVERYGLPAAEKYTSIAQHDKGAAMLQLASDVLKSALPHIQRTSIINATAQLAYTTYKAEEK